MINPFKEINWKPGEAEIRSFGRTLLYGFAVIGLIILVLNVSRKGFSGAWAVPLVFFVCGFTVFALSSAAPRACTPLYKVWFFVSACVGIVISNLALAVFFYLVFSPYAVILRAVTGRDPLRLKRQASKTCWHDYGPRKELKRYFRQY